MEVYETCANSGHDVTQKQQSYANSRTEHGLGFRIQGLGLGFTFRVLLNDGCLALFLEVCSWNDVEAANGQVREDHRFPVLHYMVKWAK